MAVVREKMAAMHCKEHAEYILKQCTLLLEEFKLEIYTVGTQAQSSIWDSENRVDLPKDSDDLYI
jgi:hypothetical protein